MKNDNIDKILTLARKLKALAEKGVDGEKTTAIKTLEAFMAKHEIKPEDLDDDIRKRRQFKVTNNQYKFFKQIIASVCGSNYIIKYDPRKKYSVYKPYWVDLTDVEFVEISAKFEFYWKAWEKDLELFYSAYIQKNKLYRKPSEDDDREEKELTPEERARLYKIMNMMEGLDRHQFHKQLKR